MCRVALLIVAAIVLIIAAGLAVLYVQGAKAPDQSGEYVAIGSSFAAGPKLGNLVPGSPYACWRTVENYPHQLARLTGLRLVDASCGGATAASILGEGPFFQPRQIQAVTQSTRLVTITVGGNDVNYIGDLGLLAYRSRDGILGFLVRTFWSGPRSADERPFTQLEKKLVDVAQAVRERAPRATVVFVTYPSVLPPSGTCPNIELSEQESSFMRAVALRLAEVTRQSAKTSGAILVDVAGASEGHDACSIDPWVNGSAPQVGAGFHPNVAGARAMASQVETVVRRLHSEGLM